VPASKPHGSDRDHGSILPSCGRSSCYRGWRIEVRFDVERRVGSPVGVAGFDDCGGPINRPMKRIGVNATYARNVKNRSVVARWRAAMEFSKGSLT
jgi:hypothetical protein